MQRLQRSIWRLCWGGRLSRRYTHQLSSCGLPRDFYLPKSRLTRKPDKSSTSPESVRLSGVSSRGRLISRKNFSLRAAQRCHECGKPFNRAVYEKDNQEQKHSEHSGSDRVQPSDSFRCDKTKTKAD